ncbi:MAG: AIPR family protein [Nitrososphaerota archaeon]|nr:AIPR family protein [Nitrososphaerota archaeon]
MSANDRIILEKILDQRQAEVAPQLAPSKFFEIFTAEQVLKDYDLSYDEIESGIVGDGGDGGVDSLFAFVNGDLIQDDTDTSSLRRSVSIDLVIIQAKTSTGFSESAIDRLKAFTEDLLDLSKDATSLASVYNEDVLGVIKRFRTIYEELASRFPTLTVLYRYASKGDEPHPNVVRKTDALKSTVLQLFSSAKVDFEFLGSSALLNLARRAPKTSYSLKLSENPISSSGAVAFVCLVTLRDFFAFITDETEMLLRSIFESNVRDYQGVTQVNEDIQATLRDNPGDDFWWLNNGITVVCSKATLSGKTLTIEDPQIVNGLQTSTEVYKHFKDHNTAEETRNLLVRVIVPPATESRDRIIKATNSQTQIPVASLRATERIHRDIEEFLRPHGLFYDRRKNFYKNEGKAIENIVSISRLAQAVMATALQRPNDARARPSSLLKRDTDYDTVFTSKYPVSLYLVCAKLMKLVDRAVREDKYDLGRKDQANLRFYVATYLASLLTSKAAPRPEEVAQISPSAVTEAMLDEAVETSRKEYDALGASDQAAKGTALITALKGALRARFPDQSRILS